MNRGEVLHIVGALLVWTAAAMLPPAVFAVGEGLLVPWLGAIGITLAVGGILWVSTPRQVFINQREGVAVVGLGWLFVVIVGALPFLLTGTTTSAAAALFESVSGFTTTGATVFPVIEELPRSILLWRSISHWIGGMGIIVLGVAILPLLGVGGAQLFQAEVPGISTDRLKPRIASTARLLWGVYTSFTMVIAVIYLILGMPVFDAVNHAMSAIATGGFSTKTTSIGGYSGAIQWVTVLFMIVAGTNYTLHFRLLLKRDPLAWPKDVEWRWYMGVTVAVVAVTFVVLAQSGRGYGLATAQAAAFNVTSVVTTTGFGTDDFAAWPAVCQVMLLGLMFTGAMAGSTGGGFKVVRAVVVSKHAATEVRKVLHPRGVFITRLGSRTVKPDVVLNVLAFFALYVGTHAVGTVILAMLGSDVLTAFSASIAAISSIGPGLGAVGPASHYGDLGAAAHVTLASLMLLGRLEFYTLLMLVLPETWRRAGGDRVLT